MMVENSTPGYVKKIPRSGNSRSKTHVGTFEKRVLNLLARNITIYCKYITGFGVEVF